ncbi:hypothetical protein B0181_01835 [Moraxella caviae]|uniref:Bacterial type II secretion system protein E domain-containing protein n=1 Tax=Moraxella caviae TaxID=34060 RepID=A0A1T0A9H7_9GAMM|nr:hypothetical protein B0181_01835 [Moraxella caviae]
MGAAQFDKLATLLHAANLLDESTLTQAVATAAMHDVPLIAYVVAKNLVPSATITALLAKTLGESVVDLDEISLTSLPKTAIEPRLLAKHHVLVLADKGTHLVIATSDPTRQEMLKELRFHAGKHITPALVDESQLAKALGKLFLGAQYDLAALPDSQHTDAPDDDITLDAPTVKFVNQILLDALGLGASDIHVEPFEERLRIRVRIDGVMRPLATPPKHSGAAIATRLKVMAQLDTAERRKPQDGRLSFTLPTGKIMHFRVSTTPTVFGEKIVLRALDGTQSLMGVEMLGMSKSQQEMFVSALQKPQGMILITGPTGSGKTVSLYTALSLLNHDAINIQTVEDPVEVHLDGINQVNINPKIGLDFADVLRSFLRQDPDVIMVGEIRDTTTADIAIKAAQTGHLVLSTLHTNRACDAITRLQNMGIATFNIASSLSLVIAQRLLRKLCNHCKTPISVPDARLNELGFSADDIRRATIFAPTGCHRCHRCQDGYQGRVGVYEFLPIDAPMSERILAGASGNELHQAMQNQGLMSLHAAAIDKVCQGMTSLQELHRVSTL